jgi:hypothetical protein
MGKTPDQGGVDPQKAPHDLDQTFAVPVRQLHPRQLAGARPNDAVQGLIEGLPSRGVGIVEVPPLNPREGPLDGLGIVRRPGVAPPPPPDDPTAALDLGADMPAQGPTGPLVEREDQDLFAGLPQVHGLPDGGGDLGMNRARRRLERGVELGEVPPGVTRIRSGLGVGVGLGFVATGHPVTTGPTECLVRRAQRVPQQVLAGMGRAPGGEEERQKLLRRDRQARRSNAIRVHGAIDPAAAVDSGSGPAGGLVVADDPRAQGLLGPLAGPLRPGVGIDDRELATRERGAGFLGQPLPPARPVLHAIPGPILGSQPAPTTLQGDGGALAFVQTLAQMPQRVCEPCRVAQLRLVPAHVAETLQHVHQFAVTELEGCRRQKQHAVERSGHRAVARAQVLVRRVRLELAGERGGGGS